MKATSFVLLFALAGCQTQGYQQYADAMARIAEANASVQREQIMAMQLLAQNGNDPTTRTVAVVMLALGAQNGSKNLNVAPPQNEALEWARIIVPSISTLAMGYFGFRLGQTQSDNAASTAQASYEAMSGMSIGGYNAITAFKPVPIDFSTLPVITTTTTNTTVNTSTEVSNHSGQVAVGGGDANRPAIVPPTVITPVVVVPSSGP